MATSQIVRIPNGGSVQVRTGVLRGAGPQGPMGPSGPAGPAGVQGPAGPQGAFTGLRSDLADNSAVACAADHWYPASFGTAPTQNDLLVVPTPWDGLNLQFKYPYDQLVVISGYFEPYAGVGFTGTASGSRRMRLVNASGVVLGNLETEVAASTVGPTRVKLSDIVRPDPSQKYHLEVQAADAGGVTFDVRALTIMQLGAGPPGPIGPQGPVGATGPQGPTGATGSAGSGYSSYDALIGGGNSSLAPSGTPGATTDQQLIYPGHTQAPNSPYFLQQLAQQLEKQINAVYASAADRTTRRPTASPGAFTYLSDSGTPQMMEKNGAYQNVARVIQSTSTPPGGSGNGAPGLIWIQTT